MWKHFIQNISQRHSFYICTVLIFLCHWILTTNPQAPNCCATVTGSCAVACRQISLMELTLTSTATYSESYPGQLRFLSAHCPTQLVHFWNCMNETLIALREGSTWEGRSCCTNAQTPLCQSACLTAQENSDIVSGCRQSDEPSLYFCLQRQRELEDCCGQSNRPDCVATCHTLLRELSMTSNSLINNRRKLNSACEREFSLISCVSNITQSYAAHVTNPQRYLPCCAEGRNPGCRETCQKVFQWNRATEKAIADALLAGGCGHARPDDKMWGCFLQRAEPIRAGTTSSRSKVHRLGLDAPKLHCCHRANGEACRTLCSNTYSREWSNSWAEFDSICLSARDQGRLRSCIEDLDEPCDLGCNDLQFCTEFNNRPAELFRRCSSAGDTSAQAQYRTWMLNGIIPLSESHRLPIRNDSACGAKWKSVACALEIKPCNSRTHGAQICLSDCVSLLHDCLDFDQFLDNGADANVEEICTLLSHKSGKPCISLSNYAGSPEAGHTKAQVTRPCQHRPCNSSQLCQVTQVSCPNGGNCEKHICLNGCRLGEVSKVIVEPGSLVRLPIPTPGCTRLCRCSAHGQISDCHQPKCESPSPCWLNRNRIDHGFTFTVNCNLCSCRSGEIACSKQTCAPGTLGPEETSVGITVTCACAPTFSPVCGSNGKTYFSHCIARCSGLSDAEIEPGDCDNRNACEGVYCGTDHRCIPHPRVCLHAYARKCHQYQCVPLSCQIRDVVCDTRGIQHDNLCSLAMTGGRFGHNGPCLRQGCGTTEAICGIDGKTYTSECAAEGRGIPKDYDGKCRFLALTGQFPSCTQIDCSPLASHCGGGIVPPGACCPVCAGVVRLTFSPTFTLQLAQATESQIVSVDEMRRKLETLVQTAECRLGAYLGQGPELVMIVRPRWSPYTKLHVHTCAAEAHRISVLVNRKSPILQIDGVLNLLSGAVTYELENGAKTLCATWHLFLSLFLTQVSIRIVF